MIGLSLPEPGHPFGWSVCAGELAAALGKLTYTSNITEERRQTYYDFPVLHSVSGVSLAPIRPRVRGSRNVGFCFIEEPLLAARYADNAKRYYDALVTGSTWCTEELKKVLPDMPITTAIQGIAPRFFEADPAREDDGKFIVFSGGKAEYRKGQDVVIRAMKVFMEHHDDAYLSYAWHNPWTANIPGYLQVLMDARGLDANRVMGPRFAPVEHGGMAEIYRQADVGLFPNRCEAGNNMVMCEFMACGKPVIASYETGHQDVLLHSQLNLSSGVKLTINDAAGNATGVWVEPQLDEVLEKLELAYENRDLLSTMGFVARKWLSRFTWEQCAQKLLEALEDK